MKFCSIRLNSESKKLANTHQEASAVEDRKPGTKISKRALVNWVIEQMADQPSKAEINMLIEKFYDEERYLKQRIRELREKKNLKGQEQFTDPVEGNDPA